MGLRRLLNRQAAGERPTDPLAQLAELGRAEDAHDEPGGYPARPKAHADREDATASLSPVSADKKPARTLALKKREPPDARNFSVWKQEQSPGIAGLIDRKF